MSRLMNINTEAKKHYFEPLPNGMYEAAVYEVEYNSTKDYLQWQFSILAPKNYEGRRVFMITSFSEKALPMLARLLQCFGYTNQIDLDELSTREFMESICGSKLKILVGQEQYKKKTATGLVETGETKNVVKKMFPYDETQTPPQPKNNHDDLPPVDSYPEATLTDKDLE